MQQVKYVFVGLIVVILAGAVLFSDRSFLTDLKNLVTGKNSQINQTPTGSVSPGAIGQQPEVSPGSKINFNQIGNLSNQSGKKGEWKLVYEQPGQPALTVNLNFNPQSSCDFEKGGVCDEANLINGERVQVQGLRTEDTVTVLGISKEPQGNL